MEKIGKIFGQEVTWEDPTQELFDALKSYGKSESDLYTLGDQTVNYVNQFLKEFTIFCKDAANKEQLQTEWSSGVLTLKLVDDSNYKYFILEDGKLTMQTKTNYWQSYMNECSSANLEKILGASDSMPLLVTKNVVKAKATIATIMTKVSKPYGRELTWADNFQELYDALIEYGKSPADLYTLGDSVVTYAKQLDTELTKFCKDADNLEALQEEHSSGQVGVRIIDADKPWIIEEGNLWMQTKKNYWLSYMNEFSSGNLEKIL